MKKLIIIFFCLFSITIAQETLKESIVHDDLVREYIVRIPSSYDNKVPIPLVLCFHGYGGTASGISYTNFNDVSDTANFIVVYPQGTLLKRKSHWNVGGWTLDSKIDDVGFISSLLDSLSERYNINQSRIYSTGMSNGGYMSFLLACQLSDRIAAIASVTGSMTPQTYNLCNPQRPIPVLQIHGTNDQKVPYKGNRKWSLSINKVLEYWINHNNCDITPVEMSFPDINNSNESNVHRLSWLNGDNSVITDHIIVNGGGHEWFGVWGNMDINSTAEIWKFFSQYDINGKIKMKTRY